MLRRVGKLRRQNFDYRTALQALTPFVDHGMCFDVDDGIFNISRAYSPFLIVIDRLHHDTPL